MAAGYGSQHDYIEWVKAEADARQARIEAALRTAFSPFIETRPVEVVIFASMTAFDLAEAILAQPIILKALFASANVAGRAVERDLGIRNLDTYEPRLSRDQANVIAGYLKPFLPLYLALPALTHIDRVEYIDKEVRKSKGRWERRVVEALNRHGGQPFRKRHFRADGEDFELDAATPERGDVGIGIDIKRIEARRDIHKRCDEIVNKANRLRLTLPGAKFGVVIYYPFIDEHINIQARLHSPWIDGVVFAAETDESIETAVRLLLAMLEEGSDEH